MPLLAEKGNRDRVCCATGYCDSRRVLAMVTVASCCGGRSKWGGCAVGTGSGFAERRPRERE